MDKVDAFDRLRIFLEENRDKEIAVRLEATNDRPWLWGCEIRVVIVADEERYGTYADLSHATFSLNRLEEAVGVALDAMVSWLADEPPEYELDR